MDSRIESRIGVRADAETIWNLIADLPGWDRWNPYETGAGGVIGYGGAKWIEGWKSFFMIDWFALNWNAEQIRLYVLIIWLASLIWFITGIIKPELRWS